MSNERTGYWVGEATGETSDDNPDGYCEASYDLCMIVRNGKPLDVGCDRIPGHKGDHWDKTYGIFWTGRRATSAEWTTVRVHGVVPTEEVAPEPVPPAKGERMHAFEGWSTADGKPPVPGF